MSDTTWRLTGPRKAAYGTANLGMGAVDVLVAVFLLKYYTDYAGLDGRLAGLALLLGKLLDGLSDPIMGYLSDRTKLRIGRRRPWFLAGSIPFAFITVAMFTANPAWSQTQLFLWLLGTNVIFYTANTIFEVPHAALASEITSEHKERVALMAYRQAFQTLGLFAGGLAMFALLARRSKAAAAAVADQGEEAVALATRIAGREVHTEMTMILGGLVIVFALVTFFGTREPPIEERTPPGDTIFGDFKDALKNRIFLLFVAAFIVGEISSGLTSTLALYAIGDWWGFDSPHPRALTMGYLAVALLSIPFWVRISGNREKVDLLIIGTAMAAIALAAMLATPLFGKPWAYFWLYFAGFGLGARMVMTSAIVPDIIDYDELQTKTRKDGTYWAVFSLLRKSARAIPLGLAGLGLGLFGYDGEALTQTGQAKLGIAILFCVLPALSAAGTAIILLKFPIKRAMHDQIVKDLQTQRAERMAET